MGKDNRQTAGKKNMKQDGEGEASYFINCGQGRPRC